MGTTYLRLRNLCELTQGKYGINLKTRNSVEISAFLNEFVKTVHNCLPVSMCRNISLRNNVRNDLYASINQTGLTHILVNLLVNALVHSHSENRKVDIILNSFKKRKIYCNLCCGLWYRRRFEKRFMQLWNGTSMTFLTGARPCLGHIRDTAFGLSETSRKYGWKNSCLKYKRRQLSIYSSDEFDRQRGKRRFSQAA